MRTTSSTGSRNKEAERAAESAPAEGRRAQPVELVTRYPAPSAAILFGVGVGVGWLLSLALCAVAERRRPLTRTERMRQKLSEAIGRLPEAITSRLPGGLQP